MKGVFFRSQKFFIPVFIFCVLLSATSCEDDDSGMDNNNNNNGDGDHAVFLLIDEESIDNGNEPNNFSETDVNDQLAEVGLRQQLRFFEENVGNTIQLYTGQVGDEGWHAPKTILNSWINTGPTGNGLENYLVPGPGLGGGEDDKEVLLDEIPDVIPLRATALAMLVGQTVFAVVYDSDVSTNYDPIQANLQGSNLGIVAFEVLEVNERTDGSDSDLPSVTISIKDADSYDDSQLFLFENAPEPSSSSEPEDITPPANAPDIDLEPAS